MPHIFEDSYVTTGSSKKPKSFTPSKGRTEFVTSDFGEYTSQHMGNRAEMEKSG